MPQACKALYNMEKAGSPSQVGGIIRPDESSSPLPLFMVSIIYYSRRTLHHCSHYDSPGLIFTDYFVLHCSFIKNETTMSTHHLRYHHYIHNYHLHRGIEYYFIIKRRIVFAVKLSQDMNQTRIPISRIR